MSCCRGLHRPPTLCCLTPLSILLSILHSPAAVTQSQSRGRLWTTTWPKANQLNKAQNDIARRFILHLLIQSKVPYSHLLLLPSLRSNLTSIPVVLSILLHLIFLLFFTDKKCLHLKCLCGSLSFEFLRDPKQSSVQYSTVW